MPLPELLERLLTHARALRAGARRRRRLAGGGRARRRGLGQRPRLARGCACRARRAARRSRVVGHIDEIGVVVTHARRRRARRGARRSAASIRTCMVGQRVEVLTRNGPLPGVVGARRAEAHGRGEERKPVEFDDLFLDVGAQDGDEARRSSAPATRPSGRRAARAAATRVASRSLRQPDRLLRRARGGAPARGARAVRPATSSRVAAVQEEVGDFAGSRTAAFATRAAGRDRGRRHARDRRARRRPGGRGQGTCSAAAPTLMRGPSIHPRVFELLHETAEAEKIPFAVEVSRGTTNTDADAVYLSRARRRDRPRLRPAALHALAGRDGPARRRRAASAHRRVRASLEPALVRALTSRCLTPSALVSDTRAGSCQTLRHDFVSDTKGAARLADVTDRHRLRRADAVREARRRAAELSGDRARRDRDPRGARARRPRGRARSTT